MALYYHDTVWTGVNRQAMNKAFLAALKSGGVLLVIDHHALPTAPETVAKELHRISDAVVRSEIEAAGFELVAESDTLSHPQDPRDMIIGDKSIRGKTDRFIYLFRKP